MEIQTYATDEERQAAVYGKPGQRTEKGKEVDCTTCRPTQPYLIRGGWGSRSILPSPLT